MPEDKIKVLLVEDDEDDYLITRELLAEISAWQVDLDWIAEFEQARSAIADQKHDLYLVDYRLGPSNGMELLREAVQNNCPAPLILLTGLGTQEIDREAMSAGAADYLVKGNITADLLQRSISHSIQRKKTELKLRASEERLRQAQKLEAMGTLAGGIAHDFNNMLAIIAGYAGRIRTTACEGNARLLPSLNAIDQTVQRGAALVRQILTFARKTDFQLEHADVNNLLRELVHMLQETFPRTIRFKLEIDPSLKPILGDASQLHQTFLNLCVNARDAMSHGGTITIRSREVPPPPILKSSSTLFAEITVEDTGIGMNAETRQRIFEPFFTTKLREGGTGLGLAVAYGIVNHHGGVIEVDSTPGQGTSFRVYLPLVQAAPVQVPLSQETAAEAFRGTERILFVEDEELLLDLIKAILEEQGYHVLSARDGLQAIEIFSKRSEEIDLVLTDLGLPGLGGWEVFHRLREIKPDVKVLLASGYIDPDMKARILKAGAKDVLQKPFIASELFQKIRRALDEVPGSAAAG